MLRRVLATSPVVSPLLARITLGLVLLPHGAQHLLGWLGGYGFKGTLAWMTGTLGFPAPLAALAITVEFLAPFALLAGLVARPAALGVIGLMLGAFSTHVANGFFMNWFGALPAGQEGLRVPHHRDCPGGDRAPVGFRLTDGIPPTLPPFPRSADARPQSQPVLFAVMLGTTERAFNNLQEPIRLAK